MSWSRQYDTRAQFELDSPAHSAGTPTAEQLAEARAAADGLASSATFDGHPVRVQLYGHANEGHANSAPDSISVTVARLSS